MREPPDRKRAGRVDRGNGIAVTYFPKRSPHTNEEDRMKSGSVTQRAHDRGTGLRGLSAFALCAMLCAAIIAFPPIPARAAGLRPQAPSGERVVSRLKERLKLSNEQVKKIQPIIEEGVRKQAAIRQEMIQQRQATDTKINAVLSPEQKKQFQAMKDERRERMRGRLHKPQAPSEDEP